ncbi:MAG: L-threonine 3-dehydrogenase, partial [Lentisphaeria bacterium]|nr:L-threonine 3-dehydrogenase [Lentisphaeria bacterium]
MRAIVKPDPGPGLTLQNVPVPEPAVDEVRIRILKSSICGTDVHIYNWDAWSQTTIRPPLIVGHEYVGVIDVTGHHVKGFAPGDLVTGEGHLVCGHCRNCLCGRQHLCKDTCGVGVNRDGAFAEYFCLPASNVWHADATIDTEIVSCFDPLGNAVHTALAFDLLGEDVLITGAGPIGCMVAAVVRHAGARHIVVTDVNPYRLELARKMGATLAIDVRHETLEAVQQELEMREGFDVGLEMSGHPEALHQMIGAMIHGGKVALLGITAEESHLDLNTVVFNGLTLKDIYGRRMYET